MPQDVVPELNAVPDLHIVKLPPLRLTRSPNPLELPCPLAKGVVMITAAVRHEDDISSRRSGYVALNQMPHEIPRVLTL